MVAFKNNLRNKTNQGEMNDEHSKTDSNRVIVAGHSLSSEPICSRQVGENYCKSTCLNDTISKKTKKRIDSQINPYPVLLNQKTEMKVRPNMTHTNSNRLIMKKIK